MKVFPSLEWFNKGENMITTAEYLREKARAETAEARVAELEAELAVLKGEAKVEVSSTWIENEDKPQIEGNLDESEDSF